MISGDFSWSDCSRLIIRDNTGDTGIAYLYRAHNQWIVPVDTSRFTYLGYYTFLQELEGNYIIKAGLTEGSTHFRSTCHHTMVPGKMADGNLHSSSVAMSLTAISTGRCQ